VSVRSTFYPRAGFAVVPTPPLSGIYYTDVAVFNPLTPAFSVQNGTDQTTLSSQTAQLFGVPTSGSNLQLQPDPLGAPYGAYLGALEAIWYEPDDAVGSYPVTLGALAGLVQWTPAITITDGSAPVFVVPGAACYAIAFASPPTDPTAIIYVNGVQSGKIVGASNAPGSSLSLIQLESGTGDTMFQIESTVPFVSVISLSVGDAPLINAAQTSGFQQVLLGTATASDPPPSEVIIYTNPLWRSIWVLLIGSGMTGTPVCQGESGAFYEASTPPYLVPNPSEQLFFRFNIIVAAEGEVGLSMLLPGVELYYWGADFADTDVLAYNQSGGGGVGSANTPDPLRFSYAGVLDDTIPIPGGAISCPPGSECFLTRLWAFILAGTSVDVTVYVNSYPAYAGPVAVSGFDPITVTTTPGGFVLPTPLQVFDLDIVSIAISDLVDSPADLGCMVDELLTP
jgi:hypothetical protein